MLINESLIKSMTKYRDDCYIFRDSQPNWYLKVPQIGPSIKYSSNGVCHISTDGLTRDDILACDWKVYNV